MRAEHLSCPEAAKRFGVQSKTQVARWERIYLEEGKEALLLERRGRACAASGTRKGRKPKLDKQVEEDLIAENQRLRMEIDYLKKLRALVLEEERQNRKHKSKAEISVESVAAACWASSQHVLLLSASISKASEIPDGKRSNRCDLQ